jgi:hypothetical protein
MFACFSPCAPAASPLHAPSCFSVLLAPVALYPRRVLTDRIADVSLVLHIKSKMPRTRALLVAAAAKGAGLDRYADMFTPRATPCGSCTLLTLLARNPMSGPPVPIANAVQTALVQRTCSMGGDGAQCLIGHTERWLMHPTADSATNTFTDTLMVASYATRYPPPW